MDFMFVWLKLILLLEKARFFQFATKDIPFWPLQSLCARSYARIICNQ